MGSERTRWTVIRDAASGDAAAREAFARRYEPAVRAYLGARWRGSPRMDDLDDAAQEVFVECFRASGALERVDSGRTGGFRAWLYGVARNVARRVEAKRARRASKEQGLEDVEADEPALSKAFDRAWAVAVMKEAGALQLKRAQTSGDGALRRVDLLRMRVVEGRPIRDIARAWGEDPVLLHRAYARARREFRAALRDVVAEIHPGPAQAVEAECRRLLEHFG